MDPVGAEQVPRFNRTPLYDPTKKSYELNFTCHSRQGQEVQRNVGALAFHSIYMNRSSSQPN